jgi:hypothetical protein
MAFKSKVVPNIGTTLTVVSPAIASGLTATIIGLSLSNITALNITVSAKVNKAGASSAYIVKDALIMPGGALVLVGGDQKIVLEYNDSISVSSSGATSVDSIVSYLI